MAYQSWSVVFGEQPSAAKWNILGTNDASFNDGTGVTDGSVVGYSNTNLNSSGTLISTTAIPLDDTVPQNTEGDELITVSITPKSTTNILRVQGAIHITQGTSVTSVQAALFRDSTANALAATYELTGTGSGFTMLLQLKTDAVAGSLSSTTFKLRAGSATGTSRYNGFSGARVFGDIPKSFLSVTEIKAS